MLIHRKTPLTSSQHPKNRRPHWRCVRDQRGLAILEMIPVIIVVMVLLRYTYGFFGVIHSATVQSIAVRNYSAETFRHRSRLNYLREADTYDDRYKYKKGMRLHGMNSENVPRTGNPLWTVATRDISYPPRKVEALGSNSYSARQNEQRNINPGRRYSEGDGANPIWLSIRYGMCVDFHCRD